MSKQLLHHGFVLDPVTRIFLIEEAKSNVSQLCNMYNYVLQLNQLNEGCKKCLEDGMELRFAIILFAH